MLHSPSFVQRGEGVALDDLVGDVADVPKELVVVLLAVGPALVLIVARAVEGPLTIGAHKVFRVPVLP